MYQHLYSQFLAANPGIQHFACHSHHYWPDVTRQAMLQYWDDSAAHVDDKWAYFFAEKVPRLSQHIARLIGTHQPRQLVYAPNTHELLYRLLSCLDYSRPVRILTTDSEFHSFQRQSSRLSELENVTVDRVSCQPFEDFEQRFIQQLKSHHYDMVFFSQVFFNSGIAVSDLPSIVDAAASNDTLVVIDGYHGFMALPTDLSAIAQRVFYLSGGYKYAQGGEGGCFMHVPEGCQLRPLYTGWYAEFGELETAKTGSVNYSTDGMRFAGSTMDFAPLYRLLASLEMLQQQGLSVDNIHAYVQQLQQAFLHKLFALEHPLLHKDSLLYRQSHQHGHFLTFQLESAAQTQQLADYLKAHGIHTDHRGDRLRFGFALYHVAEQYDLSCLANGGGCGL